MAQGKKGAGKSLVRATLAIHEPPVGTSTTPGALIKTFTFDFNPAQLQLSRRASGSPRPRRPCVTARSPSSWGPSPGR